MLNKENISIFLSIGAFFSTSLLLIAAQKPESYFIDNQKLMKEFAMTKELEVKYNSAILNRQSQLDSFELELKILEKKTDMKNLNDVEKFKSKIADYQDIKLGIEKSNAELSNQLNEKVAKRLNAFIEKYAQQEGIRLVFGANGNGSLLYADKEFDITDQVINFANNQYKGM